MAWWTAVFLGIVQGLAEFLPISSSGHLMLFEHLFGVTDGGLLFNIILHIATLLAIAAVYYKRIWALAKKPFCKYNLMLILATAITCAFVLLFKDTIDKTFNVGFLPFAFILTAAVLLLPSIIKPRVKGELGWGAAIASGFAQGLAVVPGFSRSGFTITAGQLSGADKTEAADFSFLMSIPIIAASLLFTIISGGEIVSVGITNIIIAFVSAFVSGIFAIKFMLSVVKKIDLKWFSLYLFVIGAFLFVLFF
jgi:undecaprenyl-diphosphatase